MKCVTIRSSILCGEVSIPSSKSECHRAVICAGLSKGVTNIENVFFSEDIEATVGAMESFGVDIKREKSSLIIKGTGKPVIKNSDISCMESGSTLRFLVPLAAITGGTVVFKGRGRLVERPLQSYYDIFDAQKIDYINSNGKLPLTIKGCLKPDEYRVKGNISSQFISGLLFALPLLDGNSKIIITTELESKPYIDMTIDMLEKFSVHIDNNGYREFYIKGNQRYAPIDYTPEGDFSQAAFWLTAGILGGNIICSGLNMDSLQGDKMILEIIKNMGGKFIVEGNKVKAVPSKTRGTIIDASQCPDLVPVLTVLAALSEGITEIVNAERLRIKESDRLNAIACELNKIGADVKERKDGLLIRGKKILWGGKVDSWNDHRIAMAMAIASIGCEEPIIIRNADCVNKSYPDFWTHFRKLGGNMDEWIVEE